MCTFAPVTEGGGKQSKTTCTRDSFIAHYSTANLEVNLWVKWHKQMVRILMWIFNREKKNHILLHLLSFGPCKKSFQVMKNGGDATQFFLLLFIY